MSSIRYLARLWSRTYWRTLHTELQVAEFRAEIDRWSNV